MRKISHNLLVLGIILIVTGCSTVKRDFDVAPELLTASGTAKISSSDNHNKKVTIDVSYLAKPEKAQPGASVYVLWVQPFELSGAPPQNIGAFNVDKNFSAELKSVTTHEKFDLFITAEPSGEAIAPSGKRLLWTRVD